MKGITNYTSVIRKNAIKFIQSLPFQFVHLIRFFLHIKLIIHKMLTKRRTYCWFIVESAPLGPRLKSTPRLFNVFFLVMHFYNRNPAILECRLYQLICMAYNNHFFDKIVNFLKFSNWIRLSYIDEKICVVLRWTIILIESIIA